MSSTAGFAQVAPIPSVSAEAAKSAAEACVAMAVKNDWRVSVAVVDAAGDMIYFRRMDGAPILSVEPSRMKAETALRERKPLTEVVADIEANAYRGMVMAMDLGVFPAGGAYPIVVGGNVIGAIGVGGSPDDNGCARAGIAAIVK